MKKGIFLTIMLVSVLALGYSQTAWTVNTTAAWVEAVGAIRSGGNNKEYTITVNGNISVPASAESTFGSVTGITVTLEGNGTLSPSANGSLLFIDEEQTIIARNITLQGRSNNNASVVIIIAGAAFRMEGSAKVTGNRGHGVAFVNGNSVNRGTFIMDGGSISGNTGNGVNISVGNFTMNDGTISGNTGDGVVLNAAYNNFTMNGGTISGNNRGVAIGGDYNTFTMRGGTISDHKRSGVYNWYGTFIMYGGTISNNTAEEGGGVYCTEFIMYGGTISNNSAQRGGGVCVADANARDSTMQGGTISNNTAENGGGVYVKQGSFIMQGNASLAGNTARQNGGGVYLGGHQSVGSATRKFTMQDDSSVSGNTANVNGGGVYVYDFYGSSFTMSGGIISGNKTSSQGGGVYNGGTFTKTGGIIYGSDAVQELRNIAGSRKGHVVFIKNDGAWRNASAGSTMNTDSYGFLLSEVEELTFPSGFAGTWKRDNYNNTLTITANTVKASNSSSTWNLTGISGDSYTMAASSTMTITFKLVNGNIEISGDSGSGESNWNGLWKKR